MQNINTITSTKRTYELLRLIRKQGNNRYPSVGIYKDRAGKKYLIKTLNYTRKNNFYHQLLHEGRVYKLFTNRKDDLVSFPSFIENIQEDRRVSLVSEYRKGKDLSQSKHREITECLNAILDSFSRRGKELQLKKKNHISVVITFPIYLLLLIMKDIRNVRRYLSLGMLFLSNYVFNYKNSEYVFAHRDLHSKNILIKGDRITVIDPEVSMLAESETDLATLVRFFSKDSFGDLSNILTKRLTSIESKKRFIGLTIYYTVQIMFLRPKHYDDYIEAENFLTKHFESIKRKLLDENNTSLAENVFNGGLKLISWINIFGSKYARNEKLILCYHSVSNDNWRFSTSVAEFEKQILYLQRNRLIVPLSTLLMSEGENKGLVSITFDDGYKNLHKKVLPLFKKLKITGTLFLLSNRYKVNRTELNNDLELLSSQEIKEFIKAGWEIGSHTQTHPNLSTLADKALSFELNESKKALEAVFGVNVDYFAYPRGIYANNIISFVKKAGYKYAFTVDGGYSSLNRSKFMVSRIGMEGKITFENYKALLTPLGVYFNRYFMSLLKLKNSLGI